MKGDMQKIESFTTKFEAEKFNGKGNFGLQQKRVKVLLMQHGLHKTLLDKLLKPAGTSDQDWEKIDLKAANMIQLYLADEVMYNVMDEETTLGLCTRLETLYGYA